VGHGDDLTSLGSKLGRVNRDGSTPSDNPFADGPGPNHDLIYARGLRNPFSMTFQPTTGRPWVNVVGTAYEQVFSLGAGDDAGYPTYESDQPAGYAAPVLAYETNVSEIGGCITGGAFFDSSSASAEYRDDFFFGDFNTGRLQRARVSGSTVSAVHPFGEHRRVVDMAIGPDGDLYYVSHGGEGPVMRARFQATMQGLVVAPLHPFLVEGGAGVFHVRLAAAPVSPVVVRVERTSGDGDVRVTSGTSLTFDATDWDAPKLVRLAAARDEDETDDVATVTVSSSGVPSETVTVRAHDEWTGELPDAAGGQGGEAGSQEGAGEGGFGAAAEGAGRGGGGRGGSGGGRASGGVAGVQPGGGSGEAGDGAMGTAGIRSNGGRSGSGGVTGGGGRGSSVARSGGCGCSTVRKQPGASLAFVVALGLLAGTRRRARKRA
jgi:hypothetical protein